MLKKATFSVAIFCIATAIIAVIYMGQKYATIIPNPNTAEQILKKDYDNILLVVDFLIESEHQTIYINDADGSVYVGYTDHIDNEAVLKAIKHLLGTSGYHSIEKNNNTIHLLRWTRLTDFGGGIAYSIDGQTTPNLPHLTRLVPMTAENWYYYEEDYTKDALK